MSSGEDFPPNTLSLLTKQISSGPSHLFSISFLKKFHGSTFPNIQTNLKNFWSQSAASRTPPPTPRLAVSSSAELQVFFYTLPLEFIPGFIKIFCQIEISEKNLLISNCSSAVFLQEVQIFQRSCCECVNVYVITVLWLLICLLPSKSLAFTYQSFLCW